MSDEKEILTTESVADHFIHRHRDNLGKRGPMGQLVEQRQQIKLFATTHSQLI